MTNMKSVLGWWILVQVFGGVADDHIPRAIGPYPSQEMCRLAAHKLMPTDRQFWEPQEREAAETADRIKADKYQAELADIKQSIVSGKRKPGKMHLSNGSEVEFNKDGEATGWASSTSSGWSTSYGPSYTALTPCVEIKEGQP